MKKETKYLTGPEVAQMHGQTVLFCLGNDYYAAKVSVSQEGVFMCNSRVNGGLAFPNTLGFRGGWFIKYSEIDQYYVFQDDELIEKLVELDKKVAEYYKNSEYFMADIDASAKKASVNAIKNVLDIKRGIAEEAFRIAAENASKATSKEGVELFVSHQQNGAEERFNSTVSAWETKPEAEAVDEPIAEPINEASPEAPTPQEA